ncbi:hypothetical protein BH11MYX1_BH11MYX1_13250 [soil metagenome]
MSVALAACGSPSCPTAAIPVRDFTASPTIVDQPSFTRLLALSDVHGGYDRMVALLLSYGLISAAPTTPSAAVWSGSDATLVVTGDLIDKGSQSVEVVDFLRALQTSAGTGQVVISLGNHEAEFLADPYNSKADAFDRELSADGLDPCVVASSTPRGLWLRELPLGERIGDWFFSHAGQTHGRSVTDLAYALQAGLVANDFAADEVIGSDSMLEARAWWETSAKVASVNAEALAVAHIVFGHTPDALGPAGAIAVGDGGLLFRIDTGMSPAVNDSEGSLLEVTHDGGDEVATELRADGSTIALWRGAAR